jgi:pimeloyl-ACP methyl ester carboxylesterase
MDVPICILEVELRGDFILPGKTDAMVVFAHGSGSSHRSPRNQRVAAELQAEGFGTLLFDLLTDEESRDRRRTFDVPLLAHRLSGVTDWLRGRHADTGRVGYFGASTGAAAALAVAVQRPDLVGAVVSRGGRPDLAGIDLGLVRAPTLLIVGGRDPLVLAANEQVDRSLRSEHRLDLVPGASHLFEESGAMEQVTRLAAGWFRRHLITGSSERDE